MLVIALGPGDPDLLPVASLEALRDAGPVQLDDGAAALAPSLRSYGVELVAESGTLAQAMLEYGGRLGRASTLLVLPSSPATR